MDLWIRSQDKTRLVKVCSLEYGEYNEIHYINGYCVNEVDNYDLGTYKTKERALEVLDEIQSLLQPEIIYHQEKPVETIQEGCYQLSQKVNMELQELSTYVYQIPEE